MTTFNIKMSDKS